MKISQNFVAFSEYMNFNVKDSWNQSLKIVPVRKQLGIHKGAWQYTRVRACTTSYVFFQSSCNGLYLSFLYQSRAIGISNILMGQAYVVRMICSPWWNRYRYVSDKKWWRPVIGLTSPYVPKSSGGHVRILGWKGASLFSSRPLSNFKPKSFKLACFSSF